MATLVALLMKSRRTALDMAVYQRIISSVKRMFEPENSLMNFMLPSSLANLAQDRIRLRVNRDAFHFILGEIEDLITKETSRFKKLTSPECQLALTLYRMAHGISFSTVGDLFGVAAQNHC